MRTPPGFRLAFPSQVLRLKNLYTVFGRLLAVGFLNLLQHCVSVALLRLTPITLFTYYQHDVFLCVLIYMDDLLITRNSLSVVTKFKAYLSSCLGMKDLGPLKYFLVYRLLKITLDYIYANGSTLWRSFRRLV